MMTITLIAHKYSFFRSNGSSSNTRRHNLLRCIFLRKISLPRDINNGFQHKNLSCIYWRRHFQTTKSYYIEKEYYNLWYYYFLCFYNNFFLRAFCYEARRASWTKYSNFLKNMLSQLSDSDHNLFLFHTGYDLF